MKKHNGVNERIKREYLQYLKEAKGRDEATIDALAKALARFEASTRGKAFGDFHREQAVAFKGRLSEQLNARTGDRLSKATVHSTLRNLKDFFFWLAHQPGFKSRIRYDDSHYFNLSDKDVAIARARREKNVPTLEQVHHVLANMAASTAIERRDRALIAFTALTAARVGALTSFQLGHVELAGGFVEQDARVVQTKFAKSFRTYFMPVGGEALEIVRAWVEELRRDHLWGPSDPLFPSTRMGSDANGSFVAMGLARQGWQTTSPVNAIFRRAFEAAGLPYFNPHSFRDMLVRHGMAMNMSPEAMKAWSQNLGHSEVLTTFTSYGQVPVHRQGELIRRAVATSPGGPADSGDIRNMLARIMEKVSASGTLL